MSGKWGSLLRSFHAYAALLLGSVVTLFASSLLAFTPLQVLTWLVEKYVALLVDAGGTLTAARLENARLENISGSDLCSPDVEPEQKSATPADQRCSDAGVIGMRRLPLDQRAVAMENLQLLLRAREQFAQRTSMPKSSNGRVWQNIEPGDDRGIAALWLRS